MIIPAPANPQSFNRYSYVLNNPLKYIDPNGHWVFTPFLDFKLSKAWKLVKSVAPDLAVKVDPWYFTVFITWHSFEGIGSIFIDVGLDSVILMDPKYKDYSPEELAAKIAHEVQHAAEGRLGTSVQEEVIAYQREYQVGIDLKVKNMENKFAARFKDFDPHNLEDLLEARDILERTDNPIYDNMPLVSYNWAPFIYYFIGSATDWWYIQWMDTGIIERDGVIVGEEERK